MEITGRVGTIETTSGYWAKSWTLEETCCHSNSSGKLLANTGGKNSHKNKTTIIKVITFEHTIKWYVYKPESTLEKETYGIP